MVHHPGVVWSAPTGCGHRQAPPHGQVVRPGRRWAALPEARTGPGNVTVSGWYINQAVQAAARRPSACRSSPAASRLSPPVCHACWSAYHVHLRLVFVAIPLTTGWLPTMSHHWPLRSLRHACRHAEHTSPAITTPRRSPSPGCATPATNRRHGRLFGCRPRHAGHTICRHATYQRHLSLRNSYSFMSSMPPLQVHASFLRRRLRLESLPLDMPPPPIATPSQCHLLYCFVATLPLPPHAFCSFRYFTTRH